MINLTTGPVRLRKKVVKSLSGEAVSHRKPEFKTLHTTFVEQFRQSLNINELILMQGSGTLANDAMIWQIKSLNKKGLILSNGEFGNRLIDQATRIGLTFINHSIEWGQAFNFSMIEQLIHENDIHWILFTHCETSTGVINDLESISTLTNDLGIDCFVDCMSSIGTMKIDLSKVSMATTSSGKGLCSISGIALILSNITLSTDKTIPKYLDLAFYSKKEGIPFTFSSLQLEALAIASKKVMKAKHWKKLDETALLLYNSFQPLEIIPFNTPYSRVFTLVIKNRDSQELGDFLYKKGVQLSYQSNYLIERNWLQLSLFSFKNRKQIDRSISLIIEEIKKDKTIN